MGYGKKQADIYQHIAKEINEMDCRGQSKHLAKQEFKYTYGRHERVRLDGIYSDGTMRAYSKACMNFADYVKEQAGRHTSLENAKQYVTPYLQERIDAGKSAYTIKKDLSALSKLYHVPSSEFKIETPARQRQDITRSRENLVFSEKTGRWIKDTKTCYGRFSEKNHQEFVNFCRGTGLRRSEITALKGNQLIQKGDSYYLHVKGKGGRERDVPIRGKYKQEIIEKCQKAENNRVWNKVPAHADIHRYRSEYATNYYKDIARDPKNLPRSERYCCQKELAGTWYDRKAMAEVSRALGHNRVEVIASNYLR